ncbi:hypothetical protein GCM10027446_28180 [Angustibacter peucedani]
MAAAALAVLVAVPVGGGLVAAPAAAATCPSPGGASVGNAPVPSGADYAVRGHGWGHSLGLSQYGAQGAAELGCTYTQILAAYYPTTHVATKTLVGAVDVKLMTAGTKATVRAVTADVPWRGPAGQAATQPKGSTWSVLLSGGQSVLKDAASATVFTVAGGSTMRAVDIGRVVQVRSFDGSTLKTDRTVRWDETRFVASSDGLAVTQAIRDSSAGDAVQKYLWGLAEVPSLWPTHALRAQSVAARTYLARRYDSARGAYAVQATAADQNYGGYLAESDDYQNGSHWKSAVNATDRQVVLDASSALIDALYTSSHGGRSEDVRYAFGSDALPYLVSIDDSRWDLASDNPNRSWAQGYTSANLAARFGFTSLTSLSVGAPGTSARLDGVKAVGVVGGSTVTKTYTGMQARSVLGVLSPGFIITRLTTPPVDNGTAVSGDWDGDGRTDVGWFKNGTWSLRWPDGTTRTISLGAAGDTPVVADWNDDGRDGIGVFRDGQWQTRNSLAGSGVVDTFTYGRAGDLPVAGRWTAASSAGIGVVRSGTWMLRATADAGPPTLTATFKAGGRPLLGDWDGNGLDTPGWMANGKWTLSNLVAHPAVHKTVLFGRTGDAPVPGDFDGNRTTTTGIARSSSFFWRDDLAGGAATGSRVYQP